jgi:fermentation-respiration switch protein FrsA (DUF1100 family)
MSTSNSRSVFKLLVSVLLLGTASFGCSHLAYQPTDIMYVQHPEQLNGVREEVEFTSSDGTKLAGWYFKAAKGGHKGTVIQFHGNAQNMTSHYNLLVWLTDEGYDFFTFDYRGYGISDGKPNQEGVNRDALAAVHYVMNRNPAPKNGKPDIVLYGQSLGGAILMRAYEDVIPSERTRVKAVVVESTFYSYHAIARSALAKQWFTFIFQPLGYVLISNEYSPEDAIPKISPTPFLVIHGDEDPVVPFSFGEKVFSLAKEPKTFLKIPGGKHINSMWVDHGKYRANLLQFLAEQK